MEGVGARLGRSSTRYGPPTVFTGPVRKWKKRWVPLAASSGSSNSHHSAFSSPSNGSQSYSNGSLIGNGNSSSHLLLYKWTPLGTNNNCKDTVSPIKPDGKVNDHDASSDEPPRRKFKYIPVCVLKKETADREAMSIVEGNGDSAPADEHDINNGNPSSPKKPDRNIGDLASSEKPDCETEELASAKQPDDNKRDLASPNINNGGSIPVEKPDMNNVPGEETEGDLGLRQDLNMSVSEGDPNATAT